MFSLFLCVCVRAPFNIITFAKKIHDEYHNDNEFLECAHLARSVYEPAMAARHAHTIACII